MDSVKVDIKAQEEASRIELVIRFIYLIPLAIVMWILSIIGTICIIVNFFTSLILGKRLPALNKFVALYITYYTEVSVYLYLTDERPKIIPEM